MSADRNIRRRSRASTTKVPGARKDPAGGKSEAWWQEQVRQAARLLGYASYHTHDSRRSECGFPDLILIRPGRLVALELKKDGGRTDPVRHAMQQMWIDAFNSVGGNVEARRVFLPSGLNELYAWLK